MLNLDEKTKAKLSPVMRQYVEVREQNPDAIVFFRLGDFYEMFFDDAEKVSKLLDLTLTGKQCGLEERAPMCGVLYHAVDSYISRLVEMGFRVAICEQLEDPATTKGVVKRGVTEVVTPGTVMSEAILNEKENNYLAACCGDENGVSVAYCDISTGELRTTEKTYGRTFREDLVNELVKIMPKEVLLDPYLSDTVGEETVKNACGAFVHTLTEASSSDRQAEEALRLQFGGLSKTALGLDGRRYCVRSVGMLLSYLLESQKQTLTQIRTVTFYEQGGTMVLDRATIRNLELTETLFEKKSQGSLLGVLDHTLTAMGGRLMKRWIRQPLSDPARIRRRLDAVEELTQDPLLLNDLRDVLRGVYDFERLTGRMASGRANGRDMIALRNSVKVLPELRDILMPLHADLLQELSSAGEGLEDLSGRIESAMTDDPPMTIREGGLIRPGYSEDLDSLRNSIADAKAWIAGLEASEKARTGIQHLKVGYNKVFGYYIEVTRSNLDQVPDDYIRRQTLVGAERFITPELKEKESLVLNAETKINKMEYELFTALRENVLLSIDALQDTSAKIAVLDVLASFAWISLKQGYVRPDVEDGSVIEIERGRHPVIERLGTQGLFTPNDTRLDREDDCMLLITGPNMSGKSTYMRQTALIVLMAQCGCFVPADRARIGVCDRIFTRIGASDNLAQGQSTFFVEMSELAYILRNATENSLILLDEIGRGTSTYDGLSIAWATAEYLCRPDFRVRTMFATHYHEMTVLEGRRPGVRNLNVDVSEENGDIVFLHKIVPGPANHSYGIHVARLAGVPLDLLNNAEAKLEKLEEENSRETLTDAFSVQAEREEAAPKQMSFFADENPAVKKLRDLDLMEVKPSEAIRILEELKELIGK